MLKKAVPLVLLVILAFTLTRSGGEENGDAAYRQLLDLMMERQKLTVVFGDGHPKVKELDTKIKLQKEALENRVPGRQPSTKITPSPIPDLKSIDDAQLKQILLDLYKRVAVLEEEVRDLRSAKPRIDLLQN